jgi:octaheme c-type cytochrome (tetrathionate reductase family)
MAMFGKPFGPVSALAVAGFFILSTLALDASARTTGIWSTSDHAKYSQLNREFASGREVTRTCLGCHVKAASQIHQTKHWNWELINPDTGQKLGKKHVLNNYCISAIPNMETCSDCHISHEWSSQEFDFGSEDNVDCLICHDTTGIYRKGKLPEDHPGIDLTEIAQNVGPTSRRNCGLCHFSGGGGEAVKHGDLDPSLDEPDAFLDVHMDAEGLDFACSTCHSGDQHGVRGSRYTPTASDTHGIDFPGHDDQSRASCPSCHGTTPHPDGTSAKLNDHTDRLACQTCHIPAFSRGDYATKTWWDWSTSGRMDADGKPFHEEDDDGNETYNSKKGNFKWEYEVVPEYVWFNGRVEYTLLDTPIDPTRIVRINSFSGAADDPNARIWPVKIMRGKQPFDSERNTMVAMLTSGTGGYWTHFDMDKAIRQGMEAVGMPYSGRYGFVETEMYWPISHMVASAEDAVACDSCHARKGRLAALADFYMPGRDTNPVLDLLGFLLVGSTLAGVLVHGLGRAVAGARRKIKLVR